MTTEQEPMPVLASDVMWDGDRGTLREPSRRALLEVLKGPYLSGQRRPQLWAALLADEDAIRSRLHDLFLDLVIDRDEEFAFTRKVRTHELEVPSAVRAESLSLVDTVMLLVLRQTLLASPGDSRVIVGKDELYEQLLVYRTGDETTYLRTLNAAWGRMMNRFRVIHPVGEDRAEISPVVKFIVDHDLASSLAREYRDLAGRQEQPAEDEGGEQ